jgi:hypothetical protein
MSQRPTRERPRPPRAQSSRSARARPIMKKLGMLGIIGGAALLTVAPFSLQWSQDEVSLSLSSANARIGRPLTATNPRVYRRTYRSAAYAAVAAGVAGYGYGSYYGSPYYSSYYAPSRYSCYLPPYASPPSRYSYYLPPFASVSSYNYLCGRGRGGRRVQDTRGHAAAPDSSTE